MRTKSNAGDHPGVLVLPLVAYIVTIVLGLIAHGIRPVRVLPVGPSRILGAVLLGLGIALAGWGRQTMRRAGTNIDPGEPALAIVTDGPFRFSRNPLYIAATLFYLGVTFLVDALWPLLLLVPLLILMQEGVVKREERYLEAKFGDTYRSYRARVRRWL